MAVSIFSWNESIELANFLIYFFGTEREAYFYENQRKFCVHSGAMDKKFSADNRKNTPRPN